MNKRIKTWWLKQLKLYKKGACQLRTKGRNTDKFCCLGVLCDMYARSRVGRAEGAHWDGIIFYEDKNEDKGHDAVLPPKVQAWAGLDSDNPELIPPKPMETVDAIGYYDDGETCASINDASTTFKKVAELIREKL